MARGQGEYSVWNRQEALRLQRQSAAAEEAAERQRRLRETEDGKASAERLTEDLTGRVGRLESILRRGLDREAAIDFNTLVSNGPLLRERTGMAEDSAWARSGWFGLAENLSVRRGGRRCLCGACEPVSQHGAEGRHENRGLLP